MKIISTLLLAAAASTSVFAGSYILHFPEVNSPGASGGFPLPITEIGTGTFSLSPSETIVSAVLSGTFGSTSLYSGSTAHHTLSIDGTDLISTTSVVPDPIFNVVPFSVNVPFSLLADGSATLSYVQTGASVVRLSATTLTIETVDAPELTNSVALLGLGLVALGAARRKLA